MSPSEEQLRAALRDGEPDGLGDAVSAEGIIAQAHAIRHRRLVRTGSVLGGAAAAAVAGLVIASLAGSTHSQRNSDAAGQGAGTNRGASTPAAAGQAPEQAAGGASGATAATCPSVAPAPPKGTGHGSFFTGPVASFTLCSYPETGGAALRGSNGTVLTRTVTGAAAQQLATSLDTAATKPVAEPCPLFRTATGKLLAMIPVRADGSTMAPITVAVLDNPCNQALTNGTVVRYNWTPPPPVTPYLHQLAALPSH